MSVFLISIDDADEECLCSQVNGRGTKEAERDSKVSVSPSPSNASSNASLVTPPTNTPPEVQTGNTLQHITPENLMHTFLFCITIHVFPPSIRVWSRTPSQHSICPCSRSKSWLTRNAPTREHRPWTGPRKMNSSATYRTPQLPSHIHRFFLMILTKRYQKGFFIVQLAIL